MKTKILFILHLPPPVHGSSIVGQLLKESTLLNSSFDTSYINLIASNEVAESGKITIKKMASFSKIWWRLLKQLLRSKPDLCYLALTTNGAAFYRDLSIVFLLKLLNVKRVYHLHNKGVHNNMNSVVKRSCYRFAFKGADVILLSKLLYADIDRLVPLDKVHLCPNGIKDIQIPGRQNRNDVPQILFLSNLIKSKGVFQLLNACRILKKRKLKFFCTFVGGEGDITAKVFSSYVSDLDLNDHVIYIGKRFHEEKYEQYSKADIFAFPTYYPNECFPLVLLEAMQAKLPVISTFEGGIPDIIVNGKTGFVVAQKDDEALADKLALLLKNEELRVQMGRDAYERYLDKFTFIRFESTMVDILAKLTQN